jgi:hypothetical protein
MMEFIKEIHEARMVRNESDQKSLTYSDCCEKLFLTVCIIEVMRYDNENDNFLNRYLDKTLDYNGYKMFKIANTDLYNFIYFVTGDNAAMDKLKDPGAAKKVRRNTHLPIATLAGHLAQIKNNPRDSKINSYSLFYELQKSLAAQISDYSFIRRLLANYTKISVQQRKEVVTKLLFAARAKLRSSDIIDDFSRWVGKNRLEVSSVRDTEIEISQADFDAGSTKDMAYYRMLVGSDNMVLAHKFVERSFKNTNSPLNYIQSYLPIIKMIHDFIQAGPTAIQQLKVLHSRIKKSNK